MKKSEAPYSVRQGDVLLVDAAYRGGIPAGVKTVKLEQGRVVLAHGEVTGHAHVLDRPAETTRYYDAGAARYLKLLADQPLTHEEHGAILLRAGELQQAFQVEDFGEEVRNVAD